jgi:ferrous iron transport protein A
MMPLTFAETGREYVIRRVAGNDDVRRHLEELGFVTDGKVTVVNVIQGNVIVNVKNVRVAISRQLTQKIYV